MIQQYFNQILVKQTPTNSKNEINEVTKDWGKPHTFKGCLRPLAVDKRFSADKQTIYATHKIYCLPFKVSEHDRIVDSEGNVYLVREVINPMMLNKHLEIVVLYSENVRSGA